MWCIFNTVHFVHSCDAVASVLFFEKRCVTCILIIILLFMI